MANLEHLQELEKGSESWNKWLLLLDKQKIDRRTIDLSNADLSGKEKKWSEYDFKGVNLKGVNLRFSDLTKANFLLADLREADLTYAKIRYTEFNQAILDNANFTSADLFGAKFNRTKLNRADLKGVDARNTFFAQASCIEANFTGAMFGDAKLQESNLKGAIFRSAGLLNTNFSSSNLTKADFQEANLTIAILNDTNLTSSILVNADLSGVGAWGANFTNADFTGACIAGWRIDNTTKFEGVKCSHIYMKSNQEERVPYNVNEFFEPKDFQNLIQKSQNTVDLIFRNSIDWNAFSQTFFQLEVTDPDAKARVLGINFRNNLLVITVEVSNARIVSDYHKNFMEGYSFAKQELVPQHEASLKVKDQQINSLIQKVGSTNITQSFQKAYGVAGSTHNQIINPPRTDIIEGGYNEEE